MNKLEIISSKLLKFRKIKKVNQVTFYSTLKGEVESELKRTNTNDINSVVESIAKKWDKNLKELNTENSKIELKLIEEFLPELISEEIVDGKIEEVLSKNEGVVNSYKSGNTNLIGRLMGLCMKELKPLGNVDANQINEKLKNKLNNI
jgi:Asp-tRNA(Asn)/Glu-tRNA(Gln) amidotransferase B subunit